MTKNKKYYYILMVIAMCGMTATANGMGNLMGILYSPLAEHFNVGIGSTNIYYTMSLMACGIMGPIAVRLTSRLNYRVIVCFGVALSVASYILLSRITSLWQLYALGLTQGTGTGCFGAVMMTIALNNWFKKRVGLIMGIMTACMGLVGTIFSPVLNSINETSGWRVVFLALAAIMLGFCLPGILFLKKTPGEKEMIPYGSDEIGSMSGTDAIAEKGKDPKKKIITKKFMIITVATFLFVFSSSMSGHLTRYGLDHGFDSATCAMFLSFALAGNVFFKLCTGVVTDKVGARKAISLFLCITVVSILMLSFLKMGKGMMLFTSFLVGCSYSMGATALPLMCREVFEPEIYMDSYSLISVVSFAGGAVSMPVIGYVYDLVGSYTPAFLMVVTFCIIGLVLIQLAYKADDADKKS